jgi:hypothetical protein
MHEGEMEGEEEAAASAAAAAAAAAAMKQRAEEERAMLVDEHLCAGEGEPWGDRVTRGLRAGLERSQVWDKSLLSYLRA